MLTNLLMLNPDPRAVKKETQRDNSIYLPQLIHIAQVKRKEKECKDKSVVVQVQIR